MNNLQGIRTWKDTFDESFCANVYDIKYIERCRKSECIIFWRDLNDETMIMVPQGAISNICAPSCRLSIHPDTRTCVVYIKFCCCWTAWLSDIKISHSTYSIQYTFFPLFCWTSSSSCLWSSSSSFRSNYWHNWVKLKKKIEVLIAVAAQKLLYQLIIQLYIYFFFFISTELMLLWMKKKNVFCSGRRFRCFR